jgi:hypothetical protein
LATHRGTRLAAEINRFKLHRKCCGGDSDRLVEDGRR